MGQFMARQKTLRMRSDGRIHSVTEERCERVSHVMNISTTFLVAPRIGPYIATFFYSQKIAPYGRINAFNCDATKSLVCRSPNCLRTQESSWNLMYPGKLLNSWNIRTDLDISSFFSFQKIEL